MLSLTPLVRLIEQKPADFSDVWLRRVGGAAEYAQALKEKLPTPAAWVIRVTDNEQSIGDGAEDVGVMFDVVIAIANARTLKSGETDDKLLVYRKAIKKLLLGYELEGSIKPIKPRGGMVVDYVDDALYWRDRYEIDMVITNYLPDPTPSGVTVNQQTTGLL
ncbi:hypothetical protein JCM14076_06490 [Methylosoma difficile]